ncbi:hypothetical protein ACFU99_25090 [Streptomyces sp. NPDC057654]|uniref:hypothetical protein n=1 Tax=Streptomyces sp. NPDC057654 TaxID=3346196 RepID=UPI0036A2FD45
MTFHTMIVSFDSDIPDAELDQYLKDIETLMRGSEHVQSFAAQRHIRVAGDDHSPVFVASAVVQIGVADRDGLDAVFAVPGAVELIKRWQARYPYKAVWVNHEELS